MKHLHTGHLFSFSVLAILIIPLLLTEGLFMDGAMYTTIANNFANGEGTFWHPAFTGDVHNPFFEHPPFAFYLEGIFNKILGGSYYTSRIYGLFTILTSAILIHLIWINLVKAEFKKHSWLPILYWVITPQIFWGATQNILENSVSMFCLGAIFFLTKSFQLSTTKTLLYSLCAALLIFLSFLCKGFVGLFPIAFYSIAWLTLHKKDRFNFLTLKTVIKHYLYLTLFCLALFVVFIYCNDNAIDSLSTYINKQVGASIKGELRQDNRLSVIIRIFNELLPTIILTTFFVIRNKVSQKKTGFKGINNTLLLTFLLLGISASFPLMISPKQGAFYIIPSIPYFAFSLSTILLHVTKNWKIQKISSHKLKIGIKYFSLFSIIAAFAFMFINKGTYNRDGNEIKDIKIIAKHIPNESLSLSSELKGNWAHMAYLKRYGNIEVFRHTRKNIVLSSKKIKKIKGYSLAKLDLKSFNLFIKD